MTLRVAETVDAETKAVTAAKEHSSSVGERLTEHRPHMGARRQKGTDAPYV